MHTCLYIDCESAATVKCQFLLISPPHRPVSPEPKKSMSSDNLNQTSPDLPYGGKRIPPPRKDSGDESEGQYVAETEEIRVSPVVSRKGYLNFLEEKTSGWIKRWVVGTQLTLYTFTCYAKC